MFNPFIWNACVLPYAALQTKFFILLRKIKVFHGPPQRSDLNVIENLWVHLNAEFASMGPFLYKIPAQGIKPEMHQIGMKCSSALISKQIWEGWTTSTWQKKAKEPCCHHETVLLVSLHFRSIIILAMALANFLHNCFIYHFLSTQSKWASYSVPWQMILSQFW